MNASNCPAQVPPRAPNRYAALVQAIAPITSRVRTDISAIKLSDGSRWTKEPLTNDRLLRHVNGGPARGACPIKEGQSVTMVAVLDLDSHRGETPWPMMAAHTARICESLDLWGFAPVAFRSSGGRGVHIYLIWDAPQDAYSVREALRGVLDSLGLCEGAKGGIAAGVVEIYPRQDEVGLGENGNQFILPLGGASEPLEPAFDYEPMGKEYATQVQWPSSMPVPVLQRPARQQVLADDLVPIEQVRAALAAIPNTGDNAPDYFGWHQILCAVHEATGGSEEGLEAALDWSRQHANHDEKFARSRVWNYIKPAGDRTKAVTRATLFKHAMDHGWSMQRETSADGLEALPDEDDDPFSDSPTAGEKSASKKPKVDIPEARHLCTDQANVQRLLRHFGKKLLVASDRWYVDDGVRWCPDDTVPTRYAMSLSKIIMQEALAWEKKKAASGEEDEKNKAIAKALRAWSAKAEMRSTIDAALALTKRVLTVDTDRLDSNPWLLNCLNGTVDLRTGKLQPHDPNDFITKVCPVAYRPDAECPAFDALLRRVFAEEEGPAPIGRYVMRWFGYCATASTREQVFVVHYGGGGNGKSTILDLIAGVLGDYAGTAAPGLLVGSANDRHPTEIADLFGRRMVTAHESGDSGVLREEFVKQATGGDRIKARFMRADFFEFVPTHKLQLLTNYKPTIKGQDAGIWRRVQMLPYLVRFGTPEQVASGEAQFLKDETMAEKLAQEREGVLLRIVQGAVEWYRDGLNPPDSVRVASSEYRKEQDRLLQFLNENCELGRDYTVNLTGGMNDGLYPAYTEWCKEGGYFPLSKSRFQQEIARLVPGFRTKPAKVTIFGRRRDVVQITGVRLMQAAGGEDGDVFD
jgi:putative DNA primase/helicase